MPIAELPKPIWRLRLGGQALLHFTEYSAEPLPGSCNGTYQARCPGQLGDTVSPSDDNEPFWGIDRVGDHLPIEVETRDRLELAEATLRHAMLAILGPNAINEEKFSQCEPRLKFLGLIRDTAKYTVSMPNDKITKALSRVRKLKQSKSVTKSDLTLLLGRLRHICSCLRTAKPFYQQLQAACDRVPRHGVAKLTLGAKTNLELLEHVLAVGHLQELPLSIFGSHEPVAHLHLYMDASNLGLAVLNRPVNEFI
ncbi:hypothetical protein ON010_g1314 [Phytophthora cinnamomi]|nr:hypothetical protein ON010_g1314 [Phytophthora cinnamomi]